MRRGRYSCSHSNYTLLTHILLTHRQQLFLGAAISAAFAVGLTIVFHVSGVGGRLRLRVYGPFRAPDSIYRRRGLQRNDGPVAMRCVLCCAQRATCAGGTIRYDAVLCHCRKPRPCVLAARAPTRSCTLTPLQR